MWIMIFGAFMIFVILLGIYLYKRLKRICTYFHINYNQWILMMITIFIAASCIDLYSLFSLWMIHFIVLTILFDGLIWLFKKKHTWWIVIGLPSILLASIIVGYGYHNMQHIEKQEYTLHSSKLVNDYKILMIADVHYDTIQDPAILQSQIEKWNQEDFDLVLLDGDIVEEGTSNQSMHEVFDVLGKIKSSYGSYYVYGNHDCQFYRQERTYSVDELIQTIEGNGITILDDDNTIINDEIELIGRKDQSLPGRKNIKDYALLDSKYYTIVEDHQPLDYQKNADLGIDLELSGHTHAGSVFPLGIIIKYFFGPCYGEYTIDDFHGIVTSGIAGWGFPIRTEKHCEYVVINLKGD